MSSLKKAGQKPAGASIWSATFISVFFASAAMNLSQQMSNSLLSLYAKSFGTPADQIGSLMSMFAVTALIFRFISGPAMNSFNRKRLMQISMTAYVVAYLGFSFSARIAQATGLEVITVLKAFRLLQGLGNAFGNSCLMTVVSDVLPKDKFASGMGIYACAQVIAQAIGPSVGVWLRNTVGYSETYIVTACVMGVALLLATFVVNPPAVKKLPFRLNPGNMVAREALVPAGITFFVAMGFTSINAFLLVYAEERGIENASLFFTVYALTMFVTRPMVGKLTDRFGFVKVGTPSILMTAASLFLIGISQNQLMLYLAAFVNAFGYGATQPALQSLCAKSVPPERRGSASGTYYIGMDSATIIGPYICGYVAKLFGYVPTIWTVMTIPVFMGVVFTLLFRKRIGTIEKEFAARTAS